MKQRISWFWSLSFHLAWMYEKCHTYFFIILLEICVSRLDLLEILWKLFVMERRKGPISMVQKAKKFRWKKYAISAPYSLPQMVHKRGESITFFCLLKIGSAWQIQPFFAKKKTRKPSKDHQKEPYYLLLLLLYICVLQTIYEKFF